MIPELLISLSKESICVVEDVLNVGHLRDLSLEVPVELFGLLDHGIEVRVDLLGVWAVLRLVVLIDLVDLCGVGGTLSVAYLRM